ncbi:hypothetical protein MTR67_024485, partial [Solanum verrucosum]
KLLNLYKIEQINTYVYEMRRDDSEWFVKYKVDFERPDHELTYCNFTILSLVRGKREEDAFLVLAVVNDDKVMKYNLINKTFEKFCDYDVEDEQVFYCSTIGAFERLKVVSVSKSPSNGAVLPFRRHSQTAEKASREAFTSSIAAIIEGSDWNRPDSCIHFGSTVMAATESKKVNSENPAAAKAGGKVWFYSLLLTLQYGAQPLISKRFVRREVIVTSSVLTCEAVKVICALVLMAKEGTLKKNYREWTLFGSLTASGLPAAIYALQNSLLQISYKNLDSLTFSILNQTKLFFTALFTYIILRYAFVVTRDHAS